MKNSNIYTKPPTEGEINTMNKKKQEIAVIGDTQIDETSLFARVVEIIETRKRRAGSFANREVTLMYWEVGRHIGSALLG